MVVLLEGILDLLNRVVVLVDLVSIQLKHLEVLEVLRDGDRKDLERALIHLVVLELEALKQGVGPILQP